MLRINPEVHNEVMFHMLNRFDFTLNYVDKGRAGVLAPGSFCC